MSGLIKKNKNMFSKINRNLTNVLKKSSYTITIRQDVRFGPSLYNLWYLYDIEFDSCNIKTHEQGDIVYIGLDLKGAKVKPYPNFEDHIKCLAFPRWGNGNEGLARALGVSTRDEFENNIGDIRKNDEFIRIYREIDNIYSSDVKIELRDGEWPRLSDRSILPMIIVDFNKMEFDYKDVDYRIATSYRKSRKRYNISDSYLTTESLARVVVSSLNELSGLINVEIINNSIVSQRRY